MVNSDAQWPWEKTGILSWLAGFKGEPFLQNRKRHHRATGFEAQFAWSDAIRAKQPTSTGSAKPLPQRHCHRPGDDGAASRQKHIISFPSIGGLDWWFGGLGGVSHLPLTRTRGSIPNHEYKPPIRGKLTSVKLHPATV